MKLRGLSPAVSFETRELLLSSTTLRASFIRPKDRDGFRNGRISRSAWLNTPKYAILSVVLGTKW